MEAFRFSSAWKRSFTPAQSFWQRWLVGSVRFMLVIVSEIETDLRKKFLDKGLEEGILPKIHCFFGEAGFFDLFCEKNCLGWMGIVGAWLNLGWLEQREVWPWRRVIDKLNFIILIS